MTSNTLTWCYWKLEDEVGHQQTSNVEALNFICKTLGFTRPRYTKPNNSWVVTFTLCNGVKVAARGTTEDEAASKALYLINGYTIALENK